MISPERGKCERPFAGMRIYAVGCTPGTNVATAGDSFCSQILLQNKKKFELETGGTAQWEKLFAKPNGLVPSLGPTW